MSEFEEAVGPDRRAFLKRLVIGAAFAAPVVSSFTMTGMQSVFATTPGTTTMGSNVTPPGPPPNFPTNVGCFIVAAGLDVTVTDLGNTLHLVVPTGGSLPVGTSVCIYRADLTALGSVVPAGQTPVSGYAVVWTAPGSPSNPDSNHPITLTVTNPGLAAGSQIYVLNKTTGTGPVPAGTATAGQWVVTFVSDPPFVVTTASAIEATARFTG